MNRSNSPHSHSPLTRATHDDPAPVTPAVFHILLALHAGASHGYGIMQEVERLTEGRVKLGNATLYRSIQKMAVDGMVEEFSDAAATTDERRREYRLSALGLRTARVEAERHRVLVQVSRRLGLLTGNEVTAQTSRSRLPPSISDKPGKGARR